MEFIDTNILYYKFSNSYVDTISGTNIVSINALEFLKNIEKSHSSRSKYYIPYRISPYDAMKKEYVKLHGKRPFHSSCSDAISFEFKKNANNYVLYNNESIANVINKKEVALYQASILFLEKQYFKELKSKFKFIVENNLVCHSLSVNDIGRAYQLLEIFTVKYNLKPDFRNSWNDILILSKVINSGGTLISSDKELNRFAADVYGAKVVTYNNIVEYSFPWQEMETFVDYNKFESKGYINQGWAYKQNR